MKQDSSLRTEILTKSPWQLLFKLSIPGMIGMMVAGINTFVDALFVGQLVSETALAGISLALPLTFLIGGFASLVGMGSASVLSRAIGANDLEIQKKIFSNLMVMAIFFGGLFSILSYIFAEEMIYLMGGKGEILTEGTRYFKVRAIGAFIGVLAIALNMLVRSEGKIKEATIYSSTSILLNIALTPLFLTTFDMGIEGVAWATVLSGFVYLGLEIWYFYSGRATFPIQKFNFFVAWDLVGEILSVGFSAMMLQVMFVIQQSFIFQTLGKYGGDSDISFMAAAYRVLILVFVPLFGITHALQPVVGMNYGAGQYSRVRNAMRIFTLGSFLGIALLWVPAHFLPRTVLSWLLPERVLTGDEIFLFRVLMILTPLSSVIFTGTTMFQALGKGFIAGAILVGRQFFLFVPVLLLLTYYFQVPGVYYTVSVVDAIAITTTVFLIIWEIRKWPKEDLEMSDLS